MKKRNTFIALTVLTASMLLSGCDKIVLVPGQSSGKIQEQSEVTVSNDFNEYPVTLNGTEITSSPKTVISLTPAYTEILFEMGYGDKLIAVSDYCDYPPETKELPKVSGSTSPDNRHPDSDQRSGGAGITRNKNNHGIVAIQHGAV